VGECEGMSPHTPKWAPILKVGVLVESQIFRKRFEGVKTHWIEKLLISLKISLDVNV
jgi:hypothetical protein